MPTTAFWLTDVPSWRRKYFFFPPLALFVPDLALVLPAAEELSWVKHTICHPWDKLLRTVAISHHCQCKHREWWPQITHGTNWKPAFSHGAATAQKQHHGITVTLASRWGLFHFVLFHVCSKTWFVPFLTRVLSREICLHPTAAESLLVGLDPYVPSGRLKFIKIT